MPRTAQPNKEALLDQLMQSGISLPMPQTVYDRWCEMLLAADMYLPTPRKFPLPLSEPDAQDAKDYARQFGISEVALLRTFVQLGLRALKSAQMQDEVLKAQYHMREALKGAQHLSANDRRAIREHLANLNVNGDAPHQGRDSQ